MLTFNYGSPYFWGKVVLNKSISGCRLVWDLICGTSCFYKSKTEKVTGGGKSAILPNWCCLLSIPVLFTHPWFGSILKPSEDFGFEAILKTFLRNIVLSWGRRRRLIGLKLKIRIYFLLLNVSWCSYPISNFAINWYLWPFSTLKN